MVNGYGDTEDPLTPIKLTRDRFRPDFRAGRVLTQPATITYSPIFDKGFLSLLSSPHQFLIYFEIYDVQLRSS
jgi:hypothetical protein